jgi:hypothetical protein
LAEGAFFEDEVQPLVSQAPTAEKPTRIRGKLTAVTW